ncbi:hypothetical protein OUHCRE16_45170 [Enterobacter hormaechei subsp. hoffmannii]
MIVFLRPLGLRLAVGADRDYSFLVMDFLPPRPLDAHNAFILGQSRIVAMSFCEPRSCLE